MRRKIDNSISDCINERENSICMRKRERVIAAIEKKEVDKIPSCFSLHFPADRKFGEAGVQAHLDFFRESGTDVYKIMNENLLPAAPKTASWPEYYQHIGPYRRSEGFLKQQLDFTKEILDRCDGEGFTMGTLHGICASALHPIETSGIPYESARLIQIDSLRRNKDITISAFKRIADALCELVLGYKELGVDSVFYASLGGEYRFFTAEEFDLYIKPFDLQIMKAIRDCGMYCFLHICKDGLEMERYKDYYAYCDVVNWGVYEAPLSLSEGRKLFPGCTVMGGMKNRSGVLVTGSDEEITSQVHSVISSFGTRGFILGADCTLSTDQSMHRLRTAVKACTL